MVNKINSGWDIDTTEAKAELNWIAILETRTAAFQKIMMFGGFMFASTFLLLKLLDKRPPRG